MTFNFDDCVDRTSSDSLKWNYYEREVLPMWIADMDFRSPETIIQALHERVEHGVFGYPREPQELRQILVNRMQSLYGWTITESEIVFLPGIVTALNVVCHAVARPGDGVMVQTPVYPPILGANEFAGLTRESMELTRESDGRYCIDFDRFEQAIGEQTRLFILCNPHNPVGRVFSRAELERMADICLRHNLVICSDEIHCDLLYPGNTHIPIASLAPEIAAQTITLMAPSKTFNIAGMKCSFAIVQNPELRAKLKKADEGMMGHVNILGFTAALAAYRSGIPWLEELLDYLDGNRRVLQQYVKEGMPDIEMTVPEGTYLAWLDCRKLDLDLSPARFFEREARVGLNDGAIFGDGGEGFVRLNFGCPRSTLMEALERMKTALKR